MVGGDYCQQKSDQAFLQRHGGNVVGNYIHFLLTQKPFGWAQKKSLSLFITLEQMWCVLKNIHFHFL